MKLTPAQFKRLLTDDAIVNQKPVYVTFSLTPRCNLHCKMCYVCNPVEKAGDELSGAQWLDIARQARDAGAVYVLITGGEPLLHRDFWGQ